MEKTMMTFFARFSKKKLSLGKVGVAVLRKGYALIFLLIFITPGLAGAMDEGKTMRLIFSPFDVGSAGNYAYLRGSVQNMLATRLSAKEKIEVVDGLLTDKELSALKNKKDDSTSAQKRNIADYLVTGSLYSVKAGLNIQIDLYPFEAGKESKRFEIMVKNADNMLTEIDHLAVEMSQSLIIGKQLEENKLVKGSEGQRETGASATTHPEAAYKKNQYVGTVIGLPGSAIAVTAKEGKKTITLDKEMRSMTVGDIDGDGVQEIIVLIGSALELYRPQGQKITKIATANIPPNLNCHAINMADIEKNGQMDLYLSCTDGLDVSSQVVRWDKNKNFTIIAEKIPYYIRPATIPGKGVCLVGQKRGLGKAEFIKPGLFLLKREKNGYAEGERLSIPEGVNLFDFVYADLDGDGSTELVAIDRKERMMVYNSTNEPLWVSKKSYGGSKVYIGPSRAEAVSEKDRRKLSADEDMFRELIYVPCKMVVVDVDKNGHQEVVVNENTLSALSVFDKLRIYNDGIIVGLSWNGSAMNEAWRTGTYKGYVAGLELTVKNSSTGKGSAVDDKRTFAELVVANLPKSGSISSLLPGSGETQLAVYELEFSPGITK